MERVTRIELVTKAWEAAVIPFHHTRLALLLANLCNTVKQSAPVCLIGLFSCASGRIRRADVCVAPHRYRLPPRRPC